MNPKYSAIAEKIISGELDSSARSVEQTKTSPHRIPLALWRVFVGTAYVHGLTARKALIEAICAWLRANKANLQ